MLDRLCAEGLQENPKNSLQWVLMASYLYYHQDVTILSDTQYDEAVLLLRENRKDITHPHKAVIPSAFWTAENSSLYDLRADQYPLLCRSAAIGLWKNMEKENGNYKTQDPSGVACVPCPD